MEDTRRTDGWLQVEHTCLACGCEDWSVCVASGDGDSSCTTAHGRGEGAAASGRWRDGGGAVPSKRVVLSPIPEKWLMRTQARECVEMANLVPDSFELRRLEGVALQVTCASGSAEPATALCFAACTAIIAEKHPNRVKIPVGVLAADCNNCSWLIDTRFRKYVREKPSPCINICWALLDRCRGPGLRRVDCAWKLTMQPQSALCRCGAAVEIARRSYSGAILTVSCGGAQAECRCVVGGTCDRVMRHHRALTSTRVAHAKCGAGGCTGGARLLQ